MIEMRGVELADEGVLPDGIQATAPQLLPPNLQPPRACTLSSIPSKLPSYIEMDRE